MISLFKELCIDESAATAIEYALIGAMVSIAAVIAMQALGTSVTNVFFAVSDDVSGAAGLIPAGGP